MAEDDYVGVQRLPRNVAQVLDMATRISRDTGAPLCDIEIYAPSSFGKSQMMLGVRDRIWGDVRVANRLYTIPDGPVPAPEPAPETDAPDDEETGNHEN